MKIMDEGDGDGDNNSHATQPKNFRKTPICSAGGSGQPLLHFHRRAIGCLALDSMGELFSILSFLKEEGVVFLDQKGFDFVVRINESRFSGVAFSDQSLYCSNIGHFPNDNNR